MSLEGSLPHSGPVEDIVDLTVDDNSASTVPQAPPPVKKRKSAKREASERKFKDYLHTLSKTESDSIIRSLRIIIDEKDDINKARHKFSLSSSQIDPEKSSSRKSRLDFFQKSTDALNEALWNLGGIEEEVMSGNVRGYRAYELSQKAKTLANAARGRVDNLKKERATKALQTRAIQVTSDQLMSDPGYVDARSNSMVTPRAITTNGGYRPDINPPSSNQQMLQRAFQDPNSPGLLPDGHFLPGSLQDYFASGSFGSPPSADWGNMQTLYTTQANNMDEAEETSDFSGDESDEQRATKYAGLVDLALTEAEPLDMPPQLNCTSLEHQRQGLGWLMRAEAGRYKGSILADDMGLGKTVQTIALIYANPPKDDDGGRLVLVVCPVALIATWADEFEQRVHEQHRSRIYIHHKSMNNTDFTMNCEEIKEKADVVICTYQGIASEYKQIARLREAYENGRDTPIVGPTPLFDIYWHRIVLDEAHIIKNKNSQTSKAASGLKARFRLALTGTPMQNKLTELYPLIRFLRIAPYLDYREFKKLIPAEKSSTYSEYDSQKALAAFLSAVMLRRRKDTVINGRRIIDNLPSKYVHLLDSEMEKNTSERDSYEELERRIREEVNNLSSMEEVTMSNMLTCLLRMRQAACHPYLTAITKAARNRKVWGHNKFTMSAIKAAMCIPPEIRALALDTTNDERLCASCDGDASSPSDTMAMGGCGHVLCVECSVTALDDLKSDDRVLLCPLCGVRYKVLAVLEILDIIEDNRPRTAKVALELLFARQKPLVERLRAEANARKARLKHLRESNARSIDDIFQSDSDEFYGGSDNESDDNSSVSDEPNKKKEKKATLFQGSSVEAVEYLRIDSDLATALPSEPEDQKHSDVTVDIAQGTKEETSAQALKYVIDINEIAHLFKVPNIFTDGWRSSTKVDACLNTLAKIWSESPDDKVIIFSSFTALLDVLTIPLEAAQIQHAQYTGRMNVQERNATLTDFRTGRCKVLLTSLKAGNVGLTLTQANRVIIMEPFWNPYVEDQAQDRVYRIGQSREVSVYRMRIKNTVEDRIIRLQDDKRAIIESALDNGMKTRAQGLSRTDIMYALGLRRQPRPVQSLLNRPPGDPNIL